jgi:hypothetical protein
MTIASRKEAVKAAILLACVQDWVYEVTLDEVVDAILAALDAIEPIAPTDAECDNARNAFWHAKAERMSAGLDMSVHDGYAWRAALEAAPAARSTARTEPTDDNDPNYTIDFGAITPVVAESICLPVEPTDAEVEVAKQTYWNHRRAMSNTGLDSWVGDESSWRAALIAARRWYE